MDSHGGEAEGSGNAGKERWLLTYADMITLLMVFFIILYALSNTDLAKYQAIALSLHAALTGAPLSRGLPQEAENALVKVSPQPSLDNKVGPNSAEALLNEMAQELRTILQGQASGQASVHVTTTGLDIAFTGQGVYFASASAVLTPQFRAMLTAIAPVLHKATTEIRVEGFTNDLPLVSSKYPTAWELSFARADNVLRYLTEVCGLPPHQMEAVAMGQWHPLHPNNSPANLALNRSVHVVVTKNAPVGLDQGGPDLAPAGGAP